MDLMQVRSESGRACIPKISGLEIIILSLAHDARWEPDTIPRSSVSLYGTNGREPINLVENYLQDLRKGIESSSDGSLTKPEIKVCILLNATIDNIEEHLNQPPSLCMGQMMVFFDASSMLTSDEVAEDDVYLEQKAPSTCPRSEPVGLQKTQCAKKGTSDRSEIWHILLLQRTYR